MAIYIRFFFFMAGIGADSVKDVNLDSTESGQSIDTIKNWKDFNPVLSAGAIGTELESGWFKVGDGQSTWNELKYSPAGPGYPFTLEFKSFAYGPEELLDVLLQHPTVEAGISSARLQESETLGVQGWQPEETVRLSNTIRHMDSEGNPSTEPGDYVAIPFAVPVIEIQADGPVDWVAAAEAGRVQISEDTILVYAGQAYLEHDEERQYRYYDKVLVPYNKLEEITSAEGVEVYGVAVAVANKEPGGPAPNLDNEDDWRAVMGGYATAVPWNSTQNKATFYWFNEESDYITDGFADYGEYGSLLNPRLGGWFMTYVPIPGTDKCTLWLSRWHRHHEVTTGPVEIQSIFGLDGNDYISFDWDGSVLWQKVFSEQRLLVLFPHDIKIAQGATIKTMPGVDFSLGWADPYIVNAGPNGYTSGIRFGDGDASIYTGDKENLTFHWDRDLAYWAKENT